MSRPKLHSLESCKASAAEHNTPTAWRKADRASYAFAQREGILPECTAHMYNKKRGAKRKYTDETLIEACLQYRTRAEFLSGNRFLHSAASRRQIFKLDVVKAHYAKCKAEDKAAKQKEQG